MNQIHHTSDKLPRNIYTVTGNVYGDTAFSRGICFVKGFNEGLSYEKIASDKENQVAICPTYIQQRKDRYKAAGLSDMTALHVWRMGFELKRQRLGNPSFRSVLAEPVIIPPLAPDPPDYPPFAEEIKSGQNILKPGCRTLLAMRGEKTYLARRFADCNSYGEKTLKYADGTDDEYLYGDYVPAQKRTRLFQQCRNGLVPGKYIVTFDRSSMVLHEYGHALYEALNVIFGSGITQKFESAYTKDVKAIRNLPDPEARPNISVTYHYTDAETFETIKVLGTIWDVNTKRGRIGHIQNFLANRSCKGGLHLSKVEAVEDTFAEGLLYCSDESFNDPDIFKISFPQALCAQNALLDAIEFEMAEPIDLSAIHHCP
jgi:hypothetical protein